MHFLTGIVIICSWIAINAFSKTFFRIRSLRKHRLSIYGPLDAAKIGEYVYPVIRIYDGEDLQSEIIAQKEENVEKQVEKFKQKTLGMMLSTFGKLPSFPSSSLAYVPEIYSDAMLISTLQSNPKSVIYFYKSFCQSCTALQSFYDQLSSYYSQDGNSIPFYRANIDYLPEWSHQFQIFLQFGERFPDMERSSNYEIAAIDRNNSITSRGSQLGEICSDCLGEGVLICPVCKGKKFVIQKSFAVICQKCGGRGRARCDTCNALISNA